MSYSLAHDGLSQSAPTWTEAQDPAVGVQKAFAIMRRYLLHFIVVAALILAAVTVYTLRQTPLYTATSTVLIEQREFHISDISKVLSDLPADTSIIDTEVELLKSRALAERVVRRLRLYDDAEFSPAPSHQSRRIGHPSVTEQVIRDTTDAVMEHLSIRRIGVTQVINISFTSEDPEKAALIANTYANRYLKGQVTQKETATSQANALLAQRLQRLRRQVLDVETEIARYRSAAGLESAVGSPLTEVGSTVTDAEISHLNQQLAAAEALGAERQARLVIAREQLRAGSRGDDVGEALESEVIQNLRRQRAEISQRAAVLQSRYGQRHPQVQQVTRELADVETQIQEEIKRLISNLSAEAQVAQQRVASLRNSLTRARGVLAASNNAAVHLRELERNAAAARTLYEKLLNRYRETYAQVGMEEPDAILISRAAPPQEPSSPNMRLNLAVGAILAFLLSAVTVVLRHLSDTSVITAEAVEHSFGVAHLGAVPLLSSTAGRVAKKIPPQQWLISEPRSAFAEAIRNLRAAVLRCRPGQPVRTIAVTSALPNEGKTVTTISLARTMAQAGARVVIIDCDLRQPSVARSLGIEPRIVWTETLSGSASLDEALHLDEASGAWCLLLTTGLFTPRDVFGSLEMEQLLAELRTRFDVVLLDTPPVLSVADARIIAPKVDAVLLLTRWQSTPRGATQCALRILERSSALVAGVALTQVDVRKQARFGYGDPSRYYTSYAEYYTAA